MNIIICDDEPVIALQIKDIVQKKMDANKQDSNIELVHDGEMAWKKCQKDPFDLLLLDIDLPKMSGIDIAREIYNVGIESTVIFLTNHENLVFESLKCHPFQFIRKEHMKTELPLSLDDFLKVYSKRQISMKLQDNGKIYTVLLENILYIETTGHKLCFHCKNQKQLIVRGALKEYEKSYRNEGLCLIYNGILVNLKHVYSIEKESVIMDNNEVLPISRSRKNDVKQRLIIYLRT